MKVAGMNRQEQKIDTMSDIVVSIHPEMSKLSVKGAFRLGLNNALKVAGYDNWKELASKPAAERKRFFSGLLEASLDHLVKIGLPESLRQKVHGELQRENEKFLKG